MALAGCSTPTTQVAATDTSAAKAEAERQVSEAEAFAADAQRQIDEAAAAVAEAERVIAQEAAKAARERAAAARAARAARSDTTVRPAEPAPSVSGDTFDRLALCESGMRQDAVGGGGRYFSYFQWSMSTWRAAGGEGDPRNVDYATQKAIAMRWAERSNPYGQWPVCWPRAVRG